MLVDATSIDAGVNRLTEVDFEVALFCGKDGPQADVSGVTANVTRPDGSVLMLAPTHQVKERTFFDCTSDAFQNECLVQVSFTPDAPGTWHTTVTITPAVGTFSRDLIAQ
jgi:hypothetical protein